MTKKIFMPSILRRALLGEKDMGRARVGDAAFTYRMSAGFQGDVNRTHPFSVEPAKINVATPPLGYGFAVLVDTATNSVRQLAAGDAGGTYIYGVTARPYPTQQQSGGMSSPFGAQTPPVTGVIDVLRYGYILVPIVGAVTKGGLVYVWAAASGGGHVQGGFEAAASGGNTIALPITLAEFNGPADSTGIGEVLLKN